MTKIKVKQKVLAKLREFRMGMDPAEYLATEYRQLLRALQNQYIETDNSETSGDVIVNRGSSILWVSNPASLSNGVVPLTNGVNANFDASLGTINLNAFFPSVEGTYFLKFGYRHQSSLTGASNSTSIEVFDTTNASQGFADVRVIPPSASPLLQIVGASNGIYLDISPTVGFYFNVARSGTGSPTLSNFYCELTKVSE